jgi:putative membrane-bound dehydrogenase-like protein
VKLVADAVKHAGLSPEEAVKAMTLPEGFSAKLFAGEPDVHQPVGFCIDDRGRLWVAEAYTYPIRAKEGEGRDDILIFEDSDGDGKFDKRTVFATGLNLVSGIEVGFGGVWVGAAPYLLFIPDKDGDDKPDAKPQVLLDGWAYQDTHETLNAFTWGPDGWLYGCHGVFTHSRVGKPGTPANDRIPINAGIWRYHPTRHQFEVWAEGTSNPWGIDWNDRGQAFITACVIPHLYHVIPGAHYQRQAGQHFNPYVYQDIQNIGDHVHWLGDQGPHAGNNKSASAGGGHAHCGAMIYLGGAWPEQYRDTLFMANIHGNRLNNDKLIAKGSGYVGTHAPDPVLMNDKWSRPINFKYGPDGSVYMLDWYDKQACHNPLTEIWDRSNGRIYNLVYGEKKAVKEDLTQLTNEQLAQLQLHKNEWYVRHARRLLQERGAKDAAATLRGMLMPTFTPPQRLRAMWALHCIGELSQADISNLTGDDDPYVRGWAIQLMMEEGGVTRLTGPFNEPQPAKDAQRQSWQLAHLKAHADDASPVVRLYVASALGRLSYQDRWEALEKLVARSEDADDHNLPLMYWYAAEPAVASDVNRAVALAKLSKIPLIRENIARRLADLAVAKAEGDVSKVKVGPLQELAALLGGINDEAFEADVLNGMAAALKGWPRLPAPKTWGAVYEKLSTSKAPAVKNRLQELSVIFGEERALASLRTTVTDVNANLGVRQKAIESLVGAQDTKVVSLLQKLVEDEALRPSAIRGLAAFDDPATPALILGIYSKLDGTTKVDALNTLASRSAYAKELMKAVQSGRISKTDVSAATLRQLAAIDEPEVKLWVESAFGRVKTTPKEKLDSIARWQALLSRKTWADRADPVHGRAIFAKTCAQCHTLFDTGGKVGPDLTGSNRADLAYVLNNIIDPSAVIGKDYLVSIIKTKDKRVLSGIIKKDDGNAIQLQTETELITLPKSLITFQKQQDISMMPEGLIAGLKNDEVRDLVAYLGSSRQVPLLATKQNQNGLFNGKDLLGWSGDPKLFRVENGEIVGKTSEGLKHNAFLFSDMAAEDFRLTLKIKLAPNEANSGIQFRSVSLPDGEAKGYQADAGKGWWGKLYEENGRKLLWDKSGEQFVKPNEWNDYEVVAVGSRVRTFINGKLCVDLDDPDGAKRGVFGLQIHAGGPTEVRFKDIKLEVDPEPAVSEAK